MGITGVDCPNRLYAGCGAGCGRANIFTNIHGGVGIFGAMTKNSDNGCELSLTGIQNPHSLQNHKTV